MKKQIMKLAENVKNLRELNELAESLRQIGDQEGLKALAGKLEIDSGEVEAFLNRKRYWLVDEGNCKKDFLSGRSKILDEMGALNDVNFGTPVGTYLLMRCSEGKYEAQILKPYKTLMRCIEFLMKKAYEIAAEGQKEGFNRRRAAVAVQDADVFSWADEYYFLDDADEIQKDIEKREQELLHKAKNLSKSSIKTSIAKKKDSEGGGPKKKENPILVPKETQLEGQLSLF